MEEHSSGAQIEYREQAVGFNNGWSRESNSLNARSPSILAELRYSAQTIRNKP